MPKMKKNTESIGSRVTIGATVSNSCSQFFVLASVLALIYNIGSPCTNYVCQTK